MLTKLKNSVLIIFAVVALVYLTLPWWLASLTDSYLPDEMSNFAADIDYPQLTQFSVQAAQFELPSSGLQVKLSNLSTDYSMSVVKIGTITVSSLSIPPNLAITTQQASGDTNNPLAKVFELINGIFKQAEIIDRIKQLTIEEFVYIDASGLSDKSNQIILENIRVSQAQNKLKVDSRLLQLPTELQDASGLAKFNVPGTLNIEINLDNESLVGRWQVKGLPFAAVQYKQGRKNETIEFKLHAELLQYLLKDIHGEGIAFNNDFLNIKIKKNEVTKGIAIESLSEIVVDKKILNQWLELNNVMSNINKLEQRLSIKNNIESKIGFSLQLGEGVFCTSDTTCSVSLLIDLPAPLVLNDTDGEIIAKNLAVYFDSTFKTENFFSQDSLFSFEQSSIKLSADKLLWEQSKVFSKTDSNLSVKSNSHSQKNLELTDVEILVNPTLLPAPVATILDEDWSLQVNVSSSKMDGVFQTSDLKDKPEQTKKNEVRFIADAGATAEFNIINHKATITSGVLKIPKFDIDSTFGTANGSGSIAWNELDQALKFGKAQAELKLTAPKVSDFTFDTALVTASVQPSESLLSGLVSFSFNDIPVSPIEFKYYKDDQSTSLLFTKEEINLEVINHLLSIVGEQQNIPLQILSGSLTHSGDVLLAKSALLSSRLNADKMTVLFGENKVTGLQLNQLVTSISPKIFQSNLTVESIDFSSGLQISEISAEIQGRLIDEKENLEFKKVKAKMLQGELLSNTIRFIDLEMQPSKIELSGLSLKQLIDFIDIPGLQAEGAIDLNIPMSSSNGQLVVKDGRFQSIGNGIIRYSSGSEQVKSEQNIVFQALDNFHFESFDGDISYDKDGQYFIKLHLLGSNPEFYDGYPIDFTLNLNGQLTGVFRSLFLTGNFEQAVLDQVETQRKKVDNEL